jgi:prephenate dehydrogenase
MRAATAAGFPVWGTVESAADGRAATDAGFDVYPSTKAFELVARRDALVVLAVPHPAVVDVLRDLNAYAPTARLTDVVGVKKPVHNAVADLAPRARFIGGHPMAGTEFAGWNAGSAELFHNAAWVLTADGDPDLEVWQDVAELALACGAHIVPTTPQEHDDAVARISHLPHVFAEILATVAEAGGPLAQSLAAGSFRDGTRVALSDPNLVRAMCEGNYQALLPTMDDALGRLGVARGTLASTHSVKATVSTGYAAKTSMDAQRPLTTTLTIDLSAPEAAKTLTGIGALGGRVVALADGVVTAKV